MVYKPLWAQQTRPQNNQASYFFLPTKIPQVQRLLIDVNWIFSLLPPLYQVSRTVGLLEFGTDGIAGYSMADCTLLKQKRRIIRCSRLKTNQKNTSLLMGSMIWKWFADFTFLLLWLPWLILMDVLDASIISSLHFHIGLLTKLKRYFIKFHHSML